jgi:hypothetical protein
VLPVVSFQRLRKILSHCPTAFWVWNTLLSHSGKLVPLFCSTGAWTQGFVLARQVLYHSIYRPFPLFFNLITGFIWFFSCSYLLWIFGNYQSPISSRATESKVIYLWHLKRKRKQAPSHRKSRNVFLKVWSQDSLIRITQNSRAGRFCVFHLSHVMSTSLGQV